MSIEETYRTTLTAHAGLAALVDAKRIAQDAAPPGGPLVVFAARHEPTLGLDNSILADTCTLATQCWAPTAVLAGQIADQVVAAVATAPLSAGACVIDRATTFNDETQLHGVVLTVEWWA